MFFRKILSYLYLIDIEYEWRQNLNRVYKIISCQMSVVSFAK